jgi:hypothetical protein
LPTTTSLKDLDPVEALTQVKSAERIFTIWPTITRRADRPSVSGIPSCEARLGAEWNAQLFKNRVPVEQLSTFTFSCATFELRLELPKRIVPLVLLALLQAKRLSDKLRWWF